MGRSCKRTRRATRTSTTSSSRERSSRTPRPPTPPWTSSTAEARGDEFPEEFATAQGRRGWLREAKHRLEAERAANPQPVPRSRPERVKEAKRRLEEELFSEVRANRAYEA